MLALRELKFKLILGLRVVPKARFKVFIELRVVFMAVSVLAFKAMLKLVFEVVFVVVSVKAEEQVQYFFDLHG